MRYLAGLTVLFLFAGPGWARPRRAVRGSSVSQRKRLNINPLLTASGTVEVEWGGLYSFESSNLLLPSVVKMTPQSIPVEFSAAFDSLESLIDDKGRSAHFTQAVLFTALASVKNGSHFDLAVAPQAAFFLRGESGTRLGGLVLARFDAAGNSFGISTGWSGATRSSETNPASTLDLSAGYSRSLPGRFKNFSPHLNYTVEKSTGLSSLGIALEGIEYQATPRFAIDFSAQHIRSTNQITDHQVLAAITWNLGHVH